MEQIPTTPYRLPVRCCQYPAPVDGCDAAFTIEASRVTFGRGCLSEVGARAKSLGVTRVLLVTDPFVGELPFAHLVRDSLRAQHLDVVVFTEVEIEPTDRSVLLAANAAREAGVTGFVSLGGGSVIDTAKIANLLSAHPDDLEAYVNAPVGRGKPVPGPLMPHIACPTTSGTGSEVTGIAVFDHTALHVKTAVASKELRPTEALVDPDTTRTLPGAVVAASGLDVLCHAIESFTARPYTRRPRADVPSARPMSQGSNPWSDLGCKEALSLCHRFLERACRDAADDEAREGMMWAATLAGIAFGNAGVHIPHAMAYAIAGLAHRTDYRRAGYPTLAAFVPHGLAVALGAPAAVSLTGATNPERHQIIAAALGEQRAISAEDAGACARERLVALMEALDVPCKLSTLGASSSDVAALIDGTLQQSRLLANAPLTVDAGVLRSLFEGSL